MDNALVLGKKEMLLKLNFQRQKNDKMAYEII